MGNKGMRSNRGVIGKSIILIALALLVALALPGPAQAEAIEVPCQLGADLALTLAIEQANNNPGKDTIRLEGECTYGLFATSVYDEGHNGLPVITDELTIEGNGARLERMSGNIRFRLIKATAPLTIEDLTLANGYADDPNDDFVKGGALYVEGNLTLVNVEIVDNIAGGEGGGIFAAEGRVTVTDSAFMKNQARLGAGGGLFAQGSDYVVVHNSTFVDNVAQTYGGGAALYQTPGYFYASYSRFEANVTTGVDGGGGGLAIVFGDGFLHDSQFIGNKATGGFGGAVYARDADPLTVTDSHFEKNQAYDGGAILAMNTRMTLLRSVFQESKTSQLAAALSLSMKPNTNSLLENNLWTADDAIDAQATVYVTEPGAGETALATFIHNTFADTKATAGIAIIMAETKVDVVNNIFAQYRRGLNNVDGVVRAGYNLYEITNPDFAQVGDIDPYGEGAVLLGKPYFVNREKGNYRLLANSPAIDAGYNMGVDDDIEETERPLGDGYDLGAYEHAPQNKAPVARNDSYATQQDKALTVAAPGVLANDEDADGDALTAALEGQPEHGTVTLNANGSFTYSPDGGYYGEDSFRYRAHDGEAQSNKATVTIAVQKVNSAPTAKNDSYATLQDTALVIAAPGVLDNDHDADGDELTAERHSQPDHGTVTLNANGSFTYTPDNGFSGTDSFRYRARDGQTTSNTATVTITVEEADRNARPTAVGDDYETEEDTPLIVPAPGVLGNDSDANGDALTALLADEAVHGQLTLAGDGSFTYEPDKGFYGEDSFTYRASDGEDNSKKATVTIIVKRVNVPPTAADDAYGALQDSALVVAAPGVLDNDEDADGDDLTAELVSSPDHGDVTLGADGSFVYTPEDGYVGEDSFTYRASDDVETSDVATVTISVQATGTNLPPVALGDSYETEVNAPLIVSAPGVLGNDVDANGDALSAALATGPAYGELTLNADGSFTYAPDEGFAGEDNFAYQAHDGASLSNVVTVRIRVLDEQAAEEPLLESIFLPAFMR